MTESEINKLVRRIWTLLVDEGLSWADATEVLGRALISMAMARANGDRQKAILDMKTTTLGIIEAMGDPGAEFQHVVTDTGEGVRAMAKTKKRKKPGKKPMPGY